MRNRILAFLLLSVTAVLLTSCKGTTYSCGEFSIGGFIDYSVFTEPSQPDSVIQFEDPKWAGSHVYIRIEYTGVPEENHKDSSPVNTESFKIGDILWKGTASVLQTNSPTLLLVGIDQHTDEQCVVTGYNMNGFEEEAYSLKDIKKWLKTLKKS
ncbi:MAG: hypothetical protein IJL78_09645 [Lachnospiraceae bacterium]|nr:hypothetical protein [Lachnospiraceae bacterium]